MIFYLLFGCAVKSTSELSKAKKAYTLAEEAGKVDVYPYEMTYAHSLLHKAWEEYSTANYHVANQLAQESQNWVNKTRLGESDDSVGTSSDTLDLSQTKNDSTEATNSSNENSNKTSSELKQIEQKKNEAKEN